MADQVNNENQHVQTAQETPAAVAAPTPANGTNVTVTAQPAVAAVPAQVAAVPEVKLPEVVTAPAVVEDKQIVGGETASAASTQVPVVPVVPVAPVVTPLPPVVASTPVVAPVVTSIPAPAPVVVPQQVQVPAVPVQLAETVSVPPPAVAPVVVEQPKKRLVDETIASSSVVEPEKRAKVAPAPAVEKEANEEPGYAYTCDYCQEYIQEVRYHCAVCPDFDLCGNCKSEVFDDHKAAHTVTKVDIPLEQ